jgi:putative ABC transport system permease protein|tara:strand:+ start:18081 stop:20780 length:2700 start_codon:yes stop_codon:yes gene_type:complete
VFRLTLRNISRQKLRYALTTLAVVLGVAFLSTAFFLTDRIRDTFDELAVEITGDLDLEIRTSVGEGERVNRLPVPADLTRSITTDIPGVAAVEPRIRAFNVVPIYIDDEGEPAAVSSNGPKFGMNFSGDETLSQLYIAEGRAPTRTGSLSDPDTVGEFVLDTRTASLFGFEVGERYVVSATGGNREFNLVGLVYFGSPDENKSPGAIISAFDEATAQEFLGREGLYDTIAVSLTSDADEAEVMADIQQRLDAAMDVLRSELQALPAEQLAMLAPFAEAQIEVVTAATTTEEDRADFDQIVTVLSNVLLAFAIIAVVVSAFIINNTFSIVLGQRVRELALLRSLGATGRQVSRSVRLEAVVIGAVATVLGLIGGYLLAAFLRWVLVTIDFGNLPGAIPIRPRTIIVAAVVGVGATVLSSLGPSRRVRSIPPVAALRDQARLTPTGLRRRIWVGSGVALAGVALLALGMTAELDTRPLLLSLGGGALGTFMGIYLLSPAVARPLANLVGRPIERVYKVPGRLARENAARAPRRTAATAAALTVGLALVSLAAVVSDSMKATFVQALDDSVESDLFIYTNAFDPTAGFSGQLAADLDLLGADRPDLVESTVRYRFGLGGLEVDGIDRDIVSADLAVLDDHMDLQVVEGSTTGSAAVGTDGTVLVHVDPAEDLALGIGSTVNGTFPGGRRATFTVAAIIADSSMLGNWVLDTATFDRFLPDAPDSFVSVVYAPTADMDEARTAVEEITDAYPQLTVEDKAELRASTEAQLNQLLAVITVFLGLSLFIAVLGITNTLALSIFERTRELGLLRAIGMTRRQLRRMVRWEAVIIALFGGLLGVGMGVLFGLAAIAAIPETFVDIISIPVQRLGFYLLVSGAFGMLAAIFPARRASRLNVLDAIGYE